MSESLAPAQSAACLRTGARDATAPEDAFLRLYEAVLPKVYAFIRAQVGQPHIAEDIVGRVFEKVYRHVDSVPPGREGHLDLRVAHRTLIDYRRGEGRRQRALVPLDAVAEPVAQSNPEGSCLRRERQALLLREIGRLSERDRLLLGLRFGGQRTNRDIATLLGVSEGAVSMRLLRAVERLRRRLQELKP